jgi:antitoxin (DNA-binding transcriptional repressor) of toxin-antitoxin stability system
MTSNVKGAIAEQAIVLAATKLGVPVLRPVAEHGRTDLALDIAGQLWRVQVKWGRLSAARDVVVVNLFTSRCTTRGHIHGTYSEADVDLFAVYCGDLDRCFLLPVETVAGRKAIYLRLTPALNCQRACINLADDFTFDGAVAQLARARDWQSRGQGFESPQLHPSSASQGAATVGADSFRVALGQWLDRVAGGEDAVVTRRGKPMVRLTAVAPASTSLAAVAHAPARLQDRPAAAPFLNRVAGE